MHATAFIDVLRWRCHILSDHTYDILQLSMSPGEAALQKCWYSLFWMREIRVIKDFICKVYTSFSFLLLKCVALESQLSQKDIILAINVLTYYRYTQVATRTRWRGRWWRNYNQQSCQMGNSSPSLLGHFQ